MKYRKKYLKKEKNNIASGNEANIHVIGIIEKKDKAQKLNK